MNKSREMTKTQKNRIWKRMQKVLDSYAFADRLQRAGYDVANMSSWPETAYVEQCIIAIRAGAKKAKQP